MPFPIHWACNIDMPHAITPYLNSMNQPWGGWGGAQKTPPLRLSALL